MTVVDQAGVGLLYQPQLREFFETHPDAYDYVEVVPDTVWVDHGPGATPRYADLAEPVEWIVGLDRPVVLHSIGLSIGSAHRFDVEHVAQVARWQRRFASPWHSDHLAWHLADHADGEVNVNLTLPVALDRATLDLLVERVAYVRSQVDAPFLLENNVYYFDCGPPELDEADFLAELCRRSGCGLLLDLHNLYTNVRNRGVDPWRYVDRLDLEQVVEIHVAGGREFDGFYLDAHSGAVPEEVWDLLDAVVPACPALRGVTFELFGTWYDVLGEAALRRQLDRVRASVAATRPVGQGARP